MPYNIYPCKQNKEEPLSTQNASTQLSKFTCDIAQLFYGKFSL